MAIFVVVPSASIGDEIKQRRQIKEAIIEENNKLHPTPTNLNRLVQEHTRFQNSLGKDTPIVTYV